MEFKRAEADPKKVVRTICAFANTAGGHVVIGVADDGRMLGVPNVAGVEERYASVISDNIKPQLVVDLECLQVDDHELLLIKVPRFPGCFRVAGSGGGVFVRQGSTTRLADHAKVRELEREASALTWYERRCSGASLLEIDVIAIERAYAAVGKTVDEAKLRSLKLLVVDAGGEGPSNAAVVLFGSAEGRERLLPHARFRCARFGGTTKSEILDQFEEAGTTLLAALGGTRDDPNQLGPVRSFIRRNTRNRALIGEVLRRDVSEYADSVLRELLPNAVAHADFSQHGMPLRVSIFSDRIEIENPGGWPVGFAEVDFKAGISKIRNPVIARVMHDLKYVEGWGSGYARILDTCTADGYPEPVWEELGPVLRVRMRPHPTTLDEYVQPELNLQVSALRRLESLELNERQFWFIQTISTGARVGAPQLADQFGVTQRTAERDIRDLRDRERIAYVGPAKTGRYVPVG